MKKRISISLQLNSDLLDMGNVSQVECGYHIPLKRNVEVIRVYDETYRILGKESGFLNNMSDPKINLVVCLNVLGHYRFFLTANFKELCANGSIPENQLKKYVSKQEVALSDNELISINKLIKHLF